MRDAFRPVAAAVTFLTAIPIGRRTEFDAQDLRRGLVLFPAIGSLVGTLTAVVAWGCALVLPGFPAAVLGVASGVSVTGSMHLDGLADTADGVGATLVGHDPSSVMHDPRLGTFGGAVLVFDLLLKVSVLSALVTGPRFPIEAIAAGALGRVAAIALVALVPYAGSEAGAGAWTRGMGRGPALVGIAIGSTIGLLTVGWPFGWMAVVAVGVAAIVGGWSRRRLGGVTGDTLGATAELTETLALTAVLVVR